MIEGALYTTCNPKANPEGHNVFAVVRADLIWDLVDVMRLCVMNGFFGSSRRTPEYGFL